MRRNLTFLFIILLFIASCKLIDDESSNITDPTENGKISVKVLSPNGGESLMEGSSFEIKWEATTTSKLRIQASFDNGSTWLLIADSLSNSGIFSWFPIPNNISNQCKIRISTIDGVASDMSDQVFFIIKNSNESLRLTSPVGNEEWESGSSKQITWFSSGIDSIRLEYTTNNGNTWNLIGVDKRNTGIYYWEPIPKTPSTLAKVRIKDAKDGVPASESPNTFKILPEPVIRVISPNGGENIDIGASFRVEWTSENIQNVSIAYTTDNGYSWTSIVNSTPSIGYYYWTPVPNVNSQLCKIRIADALDSEPKDFSDNTFTIKASANQSITIKVPNGNESWEAGTAKQITWYSSSGIDSVYLEYTTDNGNKWNYIGKDTKNTGIYFWEPIPNTPSTLAKVRVKDAKDGVPSDESDSPFNILPEPNITVVTPNGGERWQTGSNQTIEWISENIANVKIEYTTNNGQQWTTIVASTPSTGFYFWQNIPDHNSNLCKVRVSDADDNQPADVSNNVFTITNQIIKSVSISRPVGGEEWQSGTTENLTWNSVGVSNVKIEFTSNNGLTWNTVQPNYLNSGSYSWTVPDVASSLCKIKISDVSDLTIFGTSPNPFKIIPLQTISLRSPNGNESWEAGTAKQITWFSSGIDSVYLEYTTDNGNKWNYIGKDTKNTGIYFWEPIPNTPSTLAKVRVKDAKDGIPVDESDGTFNILPEPFITVVTPNGGEKWQSGSNQTIEWISENIANVKLEYTTNNGQQWSTIIESTPSIGFYYWQNIPSHNSNLCKVRVSDADDNQPTDVSNNVFTITNQLTKSISNVIPAGGEELQAGTTENITWTSVGITSVKIEFTSNNGLTWNSIHSNYSNTGSYSWNVPNVASTQCKIKISDATDESMYAESGNTFTIQPAPSLALISPNGGEVWRAGESNLIRWSSTSIKNVKIEYTLNNGVRDIDWLTIVASTPAAVGEYSISFTQPSTLYKVRISNSETGSPTVTSNSTFTVLPQTSITLLTPNGGEFWLTGRTYEIRWTSVNVAKVKLEYTLNDGVGWNTIAENVTNGGFYNWTLPNSVAFNSELCKVKVSEYNQANPNLSGAFDESDNTFSILYKFLRVIKPNGDEEISKQSVSRIEWLSSGVNKVKLEYTLDNGMSWTTIVDDYQSFGAYDWFTPDVVSSLGKVKITDKSNNQVTDESDGLFKITAGTSFIHLINPQLNVEWKVGTIRDITWNNSDNIFTVDIEYSIDNGLTWVLIADDLPSPGSKENKFSWLIPNTPSNTVKVRISGLGIIDPNQNTSQIFGTFSNTFKIIP